MNGLFLKRFAARRFAVAPARVYVRDEKTIAVRPSEHCPCNVEKACENAESGDDVIVGLR
jgi:hypothetical protein